MVFLDEALLRGHDLRAHQVLIGLKGGSVLVLLLLKVVNDVIFVSQLGQPYVAQGDRHVRVLEERSVIASQGELSQLGLLLLLTHVPLEAGTQ